jgi:hypothetical protein
VVEKSLGEVLHTFTEGFKASSAPRASRWSRRWPDSAITSDPLRAPVVGGEEIELEVGLQLDPADIPNPSDEAMARMRENRRRQRAAEIEAA